MRDLLRPVLQDIPETGAVSFNTVNVELGLPSGGPISINGNKFRRLANSSQVAGDIISLNQVRGHAALLGVCGGASPTTIFIGYGAAFAGGTVQRPTLDGKSIVQVTFNNSGQAPTSDQFTLYLAGLNQTIPYTTCRVIGNLGERVYTIPAPANSATDTFWQMTDPGTRICTFGTNYEVYFYR